MYLIVYDCISCAIVYIYIQHDSHDSEIANSLTKDEFWVNMATSSFNSFDKNIQGPPVKIEPHDSEHRGSVDKWQ
jgi:hypothetical protein